MPKLVLAAALALAAGAAQASDLYPYPVTRNFCPAGLQPIQLGGVVCCGTPTTTRSYSSVMAHAATRVVRKPAPAIPLGKGMDMTGDGS